MTSVIFVHGTGTREPAYSQRFHVVQRALNDRRADLRVVPCYWGGTEGSKLGRDGASIPLYDTTKSIEHVSDDEILRTLWFLLRQDPLYEMRLLAQSRASRASFVPGQLSPGDELGQEVAGLTIGPKLQLTLAQSGIDGEINSLVQYLMGIPIYQEALQVASEPLNPYRTAIARALVAIAMARATAEGRYLRLSGDAPLRNQTVAELAEALGPADRSFAGNVLKALYGLAANMGAADHARRKRGAITDAVFPYAGDVLLYQARGQRIRASIRAVIAEEVRRDEPIVLLAHSLGGIACFEMLVEQPQPEVKLLITVGSQVSFLYELDALSTLGLGKEMPKLFPKWLNVYDLHDFLSYTGAGVFPGCVTDLLVDGGEHFPAAHDAYWSNEAMWNEILEWLP